MFRTVSQIGIGYRDGPLGAGRAGRVRGGDRLPWIADAGGGHSNFVALRNMDWQVHAYGRANDDMAAVCAELGLPLQRYAWSRAIADTGLADGAVLLLRPDGYIALALARADAAALRRWWREHMVA